MFGPPTMFAGAAGLREVGEPRDEELCVPRHLGELTTDPHLITSHEDVPRPEELAVEGRRPVAVRETVEAVAKRVRDTFWLLSGFAGVLAKCPPKRIRSSPYSATVCTFPPV